MNKLSISIISLSGDGKGRCLYFPNAVSFKRNVATSLSGLGSLQKSKEVWIIQSGCAKCGKSKEKVEKELRNNGVI